MAAPVTFPNWQSKLLLGGLARTQPLSPVELPRALERFLEWYERAFLRIDLSRVKYFGSVFLSLLLRWHTPMKKNGSEMVLAGVNDRIRELLRLTNLDTLWAIYDSRAEALESLGGYD